MILRILEVYMKRIALISDGWKRLVLYSWMDGILMRARELGIEINLYQFNANGNWSYDRKHNNGEYSIFYLPELEKYDGVILDCGNMTDVEQRDRIIKRLKVLEIPVVSIAYAEDGFYYVGNDNKKLFRKVIDHLYEVHNCRSFVFAGGPIYHYENLVRFESFKEAMEDYGITLTDDMYMFGDYDFGTGVRYIDEWVKSGRPFPESFVCANDNIAAGMCCAAQKHGLKVPGDFMVTGFDNLDKAAYYKPQITTVEHNRGNIGKNALQILVDLWDGKQVDNFCFLDSECIPAESCGCPNTGRLNYRDYVKWQIDYSVKNDVDAENVMVLENIIKESQSYEMLFKNFSDHILNLNCDGIYIVVNKILFDLETDAEFPKESWCKKEDMVVGYATERGKIFENVCTVEELEEYFRNESGTNGYICSPIHFRDNIVGFTIIKNPLFLYDNAYLYDIHSTFVITLEKLYKQKKLEFINKKMMYLYNHDSLTGLYNRIAYSEMIIPIFKDLIEKKKICAMIFLDVDHFKKINDTYGHRFGDEVLKKIAAELKKNKPEKSYAYRFGGDEFVIFVPDADKDQVESFISAFDKILEKSNIYVSCGTIFTDPYSLKSLDDYLVEADKKMYQVKATRKQKEKERRKMFFKGVDISSLPEHLDGGEKFFNADGNEVDAFTLLKENNINSVRLRIWNEPALIPEAKGYCDLEHTISMAKQIKENDMHFLLDFHYSDYWADPGQQRKPNAWKNLDFDQLQVAVHDYTKDVLESLAKEKCLPDMVQVGNEIRSGMLFPEGEVPAFDQLAKLINAGIRAVREISSNIKVMIHLDQGGRYNDLKEWFDAVFAAGMEPIDVIGISFYSFWHGTFMDLRDSMIKLIERYKLPVFVVETAHPWRHCQGEHISADLMKSAGFVAGEEEQKKSLLLIMQIASSVSGKMPTGVYYWEPLCIPGKTYGSWDENMGMLDTNGKVLSSFEAYRDYDEQAPVLDDIDKYMEQLYDTEEEYVLPNSTNLIPNGGFEEGLTGWDIEKTNDVSVEVWENEVQICAKQNFTFGIKQEMYIHKPGKYIFAVDYRGTNTTGVKISMYLSQIGESGEKLYSRNIFPADVKFVTHMIEINDIKAGKIEVGIMIDSPPILGRIKKISLIQQEDL